METETGCWFVRLLWFLLERFIYISSGCTCYYTFSFTGRNKKCFLKLNLCLLGITFWSQQLIFQITEPILFRVCERLDWVFIVLKRERIKPEPGFYAQIPMTAARVSLFGCLLAVFPAAVSAVRVVIKLINRLRALLAIILWGFDKSRPRMGTIRLDYRRGKSRKLRHKRETQLWIPTWAWWQYYQMFSSQLWVITDSRAPSARGYYGFLLLECFSTTESDSSVWRKPVWPFISKYL